MAKQAKTRDKPTKAKIKTYLKSKDHKPADVDSEVDSKTIGAALRKLHGVTDGEYKIVGGTV